VNSVHANCVHRMEMLKFLTISPAILPFTSPVAAECRRPQTATRRHLISRPPKFVACGNQITWVEVSRADRGARIFAVGRFPIHVRPQSAVFPSKSYYPHREHSP
jgi:hypothetical protein